MAVLRVAGKPAGGRLPGQRNGVPNRIGWIVLQDGSQTGMRSNRNGVREPAPRIDPQALRGVIVEGIRIDPQRVDGITRDVGGPPS